MKSIVPAAWKLPDAISRRLGASAGRQRAMAAEGHLLIVLHAPPKADDFVRDARLFWRAPDGSWKSTAHGAGPHALESHLGEFAARLEVLDRELDQAASADQFFSLLQQIAPLHRCVRNMHGALQQAREAVSDAVDVINFRDSAGEIERAAELLHSDAQHSLDFMIARHNEQIAERMYVMTVSAHRLNLLAALFFPVATLAAVFGMNLVHGLEGDRTQASFWIILAVGLIAGLFLMGVIAQRPQPPRIRSRGKGNPLTGSNVKR